MDFVTVMTYDYHLYIRNKDTITGYNSPLYTAIGEPSYWSVVGTFVIVDKKKTHQIVKMRSVVIPVNFITQKINQNSL